MRRRRSPEDFKKELDAHLALEADALLQEGVADPDTLDAAKRALGNRTRIEERFYERHRWRAWDELLSRDSLLGLPLDRGAMRTLFANHIDGTNDFAWGLWPLLSLALWERRHFAGRTSARSEAVRAMALGRP